MSQFKQHVIVNKETKEVVYTFSTDNRYAACEHFNDWVTNDCEMAGTYQLNPSSLGESFTERTITQSLLRVK